MQLKLKQQTWSKGFKILSNILLISTSLALSQTSAETKTDVTLSGLVGNDSNSHRLMDAFNPISDTFLYTDLKFKTRTNKKFYFTAKYKAAKYSDDTTSDWSKIKLDVAYKSKITPRNKNKYGYQVSIDYNKNDSTYVSKFTGQIAEFLGQTLGDRYDASIINLDGVFNYKINPGTILDFKYQQRNKKYQSYNLAGISNLDYSHNKLALAVNYTIDDAAEFIIRSDFTKRNYQDRRAKDLTGIDINGTNLEYNLFSLRAVYAYQVSKASQWKTSIKLGQRSDNEAGYWDSKSNSFSIATQQIFGDDHRVSAKLKYSVFEYDNRVDTIGIDLEELAKANKGFSLDFEHRWVFYREAKSEIATYAIIEIDSFNSSTREYEYQRNRISIGVRWDVN